MVLMVVGVGGDDFKKRCLHARFVIIVVLMVVGTGVDDLSL